MKTALITDLHANREAVTAVLEHAQSQAVSGFAFLGDFVGYGADPGWVIDTVRTYVAEGALAVQGNHDLAVVQGTPAGMRIDARHVIDWTRAQLNAEQLDFLAGLPLTLHRGEQLFVHANAWAPAQWEYVSGRRDAVRSLRATSRRYTFCGHMHEPRLYHLASSGHAGEFVPTPGVAVPVPPHRQWLVIPGSAGQPRDGNPAACYALFDDEASTITFHRVPYDTQTAAGKMRAAELPQRLAMRLSEGE